MEESFMSYHDLILILIPIVFNGVNIFILQKVFENIKSKKAIKNEYYSELRQKIDTSLVLFLITVALLNNKEGVNNTELNKVVGEFLNNNMDIYYYYEENKAMFNNYEKHMKEIKSLVEQLVDCSQQNNVDLDQFSRLYNQSRDELIITKNLCLKTQLKLSE